MSTNGDDPAGIQREKQDVKPRMTQSRLGSVAFPNHLNNARHTPAAASSGRAASAVFSQRPATSTPASGAHTAHDQSKQPLFRPRDTQSPEASARAPIKLDDDDDSLWAELDAADPSFTQEAIEIDKRPVESVSKGTADLSLNTTYASPQDLPNHDNYDVVAEAVAVGEESSAEKVADVIDMSLDDDTEDSVYMSGRSKRPRKVSCISARAVEQRLTSKMMHAELATGSLNT